MDSPSEERNKGLRSPGLFGTPGSTSPATPGPSPGVPSAPGTPGSSTGSVMSPETEGYDPIYHVPQELAKLGWRKCKSTKENKPYYYNKNTKESLWHMPALPGESVDHFKDPLGIHPDSSPSVVGSPSVNEQKRRASQDLMLSPAKRQHTVYKKFWNFDIPSNVEIYQRQPCFLPPPLPEMENDRMCLTVKLRQNLQELCQSREGIDAPSEAFNRWMLERKMSDRGSDPMLPSQCDEAISESMYREIVNDLPIKLTRPKYSSDARRQVIKYAEHALQMINKRSASKDSRKCVIWTANETLEWLRKVPNSTYQEYMERLGHLRTKCHPHLVDAAKASVQSICTKVYNSSCDNVKKLHEKHWQIMKQHQIPQPGADQKVPPPRRVMCYPIQMAVPTPRGIPGIEHIIDTDVVYVQYKREALKINLPHFQKLEELYKLSCTSDPNYEFFLLRVWCLLKRYQTLFGTLPREGFGMQGALPPSVFECLHRAFGVTFELFASPFNCYFKQYCSVMPDTDGYFGSRGVFQEFCPVSGSFEANPPFCEEMMEKMADHMEDLLSKTERPLSFCVFVPEWRDPPTQCMIRLESSMWKRGQLTIPALEHDYRHGFQHVSSKDQMDVKSSHATLCVFLQNAAGYDKWGPTTDRVRDLALAFQRKDHSSGDRGHH